MMRSYLVWIWFFWFAISVFAQQAPPAQADRRITLDVVVNDKSGTPVGGLEQRDFTTLDNKLPQPILSFAAIGQTNPSDAPAEIVLVIDSVNTSFSRVAFARAQIEKFLRQDGGRLSRPLSIDFLSDSGIEAQHGASSDGNALVAYIDQHETALRSIRRSQGFYGAADRAQLSIRSLQQLAAYELGRPGRKIMIWVSPGWPLLSGPTMDLTLKEEQNIFNTVVSVSAQLRQARITLYTVDPLGTSDSGGFRTFYYREFLKGVTAPKKAQFGNLALQVMADQSGGRVLNANNDVAGEIERCIRDANSYYTLSFEPRAGDGPDEYHAIEVKIAKPNLTAQTRSGYYAQPVRPRTQ